MRRKAWLALAVVTLSLLSGCVSPSAEVNRLAITDLLGIDQTEDGRIRVSAHIIVPAQLGIGGGGGGGGGGSQGAPFFTADAVGESIPDALDRLDLSIPRRLFTGHTQLIILGEEFAKTGAFRAIDFIIRSRELRPDMLIAVTRGDAKDILELVPALSSIAGSAWKQQIEEQRSIVTSGRNFMVGLGEQGQDPYLTLLEPRNLPRAGTKGSSAGVGEAEITGAGIFRNDRLVGFLDKDEARGLQELVETLSRFTVTVPEEVVLKALDVSPDADSRADPRPNATGVVEADRRTGTISLAVKKLQTSRKVEATDPPTIRIRVRVQDDLEGNTTPLNVEETRVARAVESAASDEVAQSIQKTVKKLQEMGADPAGFGSTIRRERPDWWRVLRNNWRDAYRDMKLTFDVEVKVKRTGLGTSPAGVPDTSTGFAGERWEGTSD